MTGESSTSESKVIGTLLKVMRTRRQLLAERRTGETTLVDTRAGLQQREVSFSDYSAVVALKTACGLRGDSLANWQRLWRDNPVIAAGVSLSMGWVLESTGRIVGYLGNVPRLYHYGGRRLLTAIATNLAIEPAYRGRALALLAAFYRQRNVDLMLDTTAIESVANLSKMLKAKVLPQPDYETVLFWVFDAYRFSRAIAAKFGIAGHTGTLMAGFGSLALRADIAIRHRRPSPIATTRITHAPIAQIGAEIEALWLRKVEERPRLWADRTAQSLCWQFNLANDQRQTMVLCCRRENRLVGYAIVLYRTDHETGLHRAILADLLVEGDNLGITDSLIGAALANARLHRSDVFEVLGFPRHIRRVLLRWRPYSRSYPACPFVYKASDPGMQAALADPDVWYATPFDGDTTLMP